MFMVDFLVMLCENAKIYKYHHLKDSIPNICGESISVESASKVLEPYIKIVKNAALEQEAINWIDKQFGEYKKTFPDNLFRRCEINGFDGFHVINENNANAILCDFVNYLSSISLVDITFVI